MGTSLLHCNQQVASKLAVENFPIDIVPLSLRVDALDQNTFSFHAALSGATQKFLVPESVASSHAPGGAKGEK